MKYKLYPKFLSHETCSYLLQHAKDTFEIDYRTTKGWNARTNTNIDFEKEVINLIGPILKEDTSYQIEWINLTEYKFKNQLRLHTDTRSNKTIICNITDGYEGGEFLIEGEDNIKMELGDVIVLNGGKVSHGVSRVTKGYRASFNIWLTENVNKNII